MTIQNSEGVTSYSFMSTLWPPITIQGVHGSAESAATAATDFKEHMDKVN